eukprot:3337098-Rhodomonas_salina.3
MSSSSRTASVISAWKWHSLCQHQAFQGKCTDTWGNATSVFFGGDLLLRLTCFFSVPPSPFIVKPSSTAKGVCAMSTPKPAQAGRSSLYVKVQVRRITFEEKRGVRGMGQGAHQREVFGPVNSSVTVIVRPVQFASSLQLCGANPNSQWEIASHAGVGLGSTTKTRFEAERNENMLVHTHTK